MLCSPPTSCAEADTASWMWIEPMSADASFGQNRAAEYDARPSIEESCRERVSPLLDISGRRGTTYFNQRMLNICSAV